MSDGNRDNLSGILGFAAKLIIGGGLAAGAAYAAYNVAQEFQTHENGSRARPIPRPSPIDPNPRYNSQRETSRQVGRSAGPAECYICHETLMGRDISRAQPCRHIFHEECIDMRTSCPQCHTRITALQ